MDRTHEKFRVIFIYSALTLITFAVFWQVHTFDFVNYDDGEYVSQNTHILTGLTFSNIKWLFTKDVGRWHPLTGLTHILDCELFGLNSGRHHLTNLLFHIANTLLFFAVFKRATGTLWQSAFVAALFAIHPLHIEAVAWISCRKDVLSTLFWILTIGAYFRYVESRGVGWYAAALVLFVLGLMAKPMLITLPFILLLLDYWPLHRFNFKVSLQLVWEKVPFFALSIGSSIVTFFIQKDIGAVTQISVIPLSGRIENAIVSYLRYIEKMFWPLDLTVFYPYPHNGLSAWLVLASAVIVLLITTLVIHMTGKYRYLSVGWFWYIGILAPVIGLVQIGDHAMADRYTYISLIGLFIIIAWGAGDLLVAWKYRKIMLSLSAIVVVLVLSICAWIQANYWRNSQTLFEHAIKVTTGNYKAYNNLGVVYGQLAQWSESIEYLNKAIEINPNFVEPYQNLAIVFCKLGQYQKAMEVCNQAIQIRPQNVNIYLQLGYAYSAMSSNRQAADAYNKAIHIRPDNAEAYFGLGIAQVNLGMVTDAINSFKQAVTTNPNYAEAYNNMGAAYNDIGRFRDAFESFKHAISLKPDYIDAHYNLGVVSLSVGDKDAAQKEYEILKKLDAEKAKALLTLIQK